MFSSIDTEECSGLKKKSTLGGQKQHFRVNAKAKRIRIDTFPKTPVLV